MIQEEPGCGSGANIGKAGMGKAGVDLEKAGPKLKGAGMELEDAGMDLQGTGLALPRTGMAWNGTGAVSYTPLTLPHKTEGELTGGRVSIKTNKETRR